MQAGRWEELRSEIESRRVADQQRENNNGSNDNVWNNSDTEDTQPGADFQPTSKMPTWPTRPAILHTIQEYARNASRQNRRLLRENQRLLELSKKPDSQLFLQTMEQRNAELQSQLSELRSNLVEKTDECTQARTLYEQVRDKLLRANARHKREYNQIRDTLHEVSAQRDRANEEWNKAGKANLRNSQLLQEERKKNQSLRSEVAKLQQRISKYEAATKVFTNIKDSSTNVSSEASNNTKETAVNLLSDEETSNTTSSKDVSMVTQGRSRSFAAPTTNNSNNNNRHSRSTTSNNRGSTNHPHSNRRDDQSLSSSNDNSNDNTRGINVRINPSQGRVISSHTHQRASPQPDFIIDEQIKNQIVQMQQDEQRQRMDQRHRARHPQPEEDPEEVDRARNRHSGRNDPRKRRKDHFRHEHKYDGQPDAQDFGQHQHYGHPGYPHPGFINQARRKGGKGRGNGRNRQKRPNSGLQHHGQRSGGQRGSINEDCRPGPPPHQFISNHGPGSMQASNKQGSRRDQNKTKSNN